MSQLSVIVVNFNAGTALAYCLASIKEHAPGAAVIVVDNASTDGSERATEDPRFGARLLRNPFNVGFGKAANQGLAVNEQPVVLLLNPDCRLLSGAVEALVRELETHSECGAAGPRVLNEDGSTQGSVRGDPSIMTGLFGRTTLLTRLFPDSGAARRNVRTLDVAVTGTDSIAVDWVSGACLMLRATAVRAINGFDERYFLYWEDADLCRRLRNAGFSTRYVPQATVVHTAGVSSRSVKTLSIKAFHRSAFIYYATHVGRSPVTRAVARMILEVRCRLKLLADRFAGSRS